MRPAIRGKAKKGQSKNQVYTNPRLTPEVRAANLLQRLTVKEKISQLDCHFEGWKYCERQGREIRLTTFYKEIFAKRAPGTVHGILRSDAFTRKDVNTGLHPADACRAMNMLQAYSLEHTRWKIPLLATEECVHGMLALQGTTFPAGLGMASSWNPELLKSMGRAAGTEARRLGTSVGFGPVMDIAQDPRWARCEETLGEDPYLAGKLGVAYLQGLQEPVAGETRRFICTLKHFTVHGSTEGGHNVGHPHIGERELHEMHLPPFRQAVAAGAGSIMSSYTSVDGVPCTGDPRLLTKTLRRQWKFRGVVISDAYAIDLMVFAGVAADKTAAAARALRAGVDICLGDEYTCLEQALQRGLITMADIDRAVRRVLACKFQLGLFEQPFVQESDSVPEVHSAAHQEVALQAGRESIVLLKNENQILSLNPGLTSLAVVGPHCDNIYGQLGDYTAFQPDGKIITFLQGIRAAVSPQTTIHTAMGCMIKDPSREGIAAAVAAAQKAEVVVALVGGSSNRAAPMQFTAGGAAVVEAGSKLERETGEGPARANLELPGAQLELLQALKATGKPLIVVVVQGRPYSVSWAAEHADALLTTWYPGEKGGCALADVLFGRYNPSGRLTISIPRFVGQLPVYYNHSYQARKDYVDMTCKPLFPFGYGLSYTTFTYTELKLRPASIQAGESTTASVLVKNTGAEAGATVVQLYIRDRLATCIRPLKELKGFAKVHLEPGEQKLVKLAITPDELCFHNEKLEKIVEPGEFTIMAGGNSQELIDATLTVTGKLKKLKP